MAPLENDAAGAINNAAQRRRDPDLIAATTYF